MNEDPEFGIPEPLWHGPLIQRRPIGQVGLCKAQHGKNKQKQYSQFFHKRYFRVEVNCFQL
jgi:hypothetical protein